MNTAKYLNRINTTRLAGAVFALLAASGLPVMAQQSDHHSDWQPEEKAVVLHGTLDQPLKGEKHDSHSVMSITQMDGENTYTLKIENGKKTAEINGKAVPQRRIRTSADTVEILGQDGEVVATFNTAHGEHSHRWMTGSGPAGAWRDAKGGSLRGLTTQPPTPPAAPKAPSEPRAYAYAMPVDPPPVMLGITMSDNIEDDEDGITVETVIDNLPAARAGLKSGDVIRELDGKKVKNRKTLKEVMTDKQAGDLLKVVVERDGDTVNLAVKLEAYSAEKLGQGRMAVAVEAPEGGGQNMAFRERTQKWHEDAVRAIEKAMREIHENENLKPEKIKAQIQMELEKAMKALEGAKNEAGTQWRMFMQDGAGAGGRNFQPGEIVVTPAPAPRGQSDALGKKLDKLADQLERLGNRLDALEKKLDQRGGDR